MNRQARNASIGSLDVHDLLNHLATKRHASGSSNVCAFSAVMVVASWSYETGSVFGCAILRSFKLMVRVPISTSLILAGQLAARLWQNLGPRDASSSVQSVEDACGSSQSSSDVSECTARSTSEKRRVNYSVQTIPAPIFTECAVLAHQSDSALAAKRS